MWKPLNFVTIDCTVQTQLLLWPTNISASRLDTQLRRGMTSGTGTITLLTTSDRFYLLCSHKGFGPAADLERVTPVGGKAQSYN